MKTNFQFGHLALLILFNYPDQMMSAIKASGVCDHAPNKMLCLPEDYSKFELPFVDTVNVVEIGIDISDVLRINDKVWNVQFIDLLGRPTVTKAGSDHYFHTLATIIYSILFTGNEMRSSFQEYLSQDRCHQRSTRPDP